MSVLIKGMEMPKRCEDCFCYRHNAEYDYAYCNISSVNVLGHGNARLDDCPLIPVPPHGRLIDADALDEIIQEEISKDYNKEHRPKVTWSRAFELFEDMVLAAPTIIPAEEEA